MDQSTQEKNFPIIKPDFDLTIESSLEKIEKILNSNMVTGVNRFVKEFENEVSKLFSTDVMAVSSCTSGMVLAMNALGVRNGEVIMPSFSFSASAHMAYWNNNSPVFAEINKESLNLDPNSVRKMISDKTKAILAVHLYGNPAPIKELREICEEHDLKLLFDSAHAFGSEYQGKPVAQYGDASSFSLSPTKVLSTVEGGIVSSEDQDLLPKLDLLRNYGNDSNYNCPIPGLNARMSEIHAAIGLSNLAHFESWLNNRIKIAKLYEKELGELEGIEYQKVDSSDKSTYKDFSIFLDKEKFGVDRNEASKELRKNNISTKFYFYPPQHLLEPYVDCKKDNLDITMWATNNVLSLPIWNNMTEEEALFIVDKVKKLKK